MKAEKIDVNYEEIKALLKNTKRYFEDTDKISKITEKGVADFTTQVDYTIQELLYKVLGEKYPSIQFLGEEGEKRDIDWTKPVWILDPVDGTTNLIHDFHESAVSLGLWDGEKLAFGCVYNPFCEELYSAEYGKGAYLNGKEISVSTRLSLKNSLMIVGTSPYEKQRTEQVFETLKNIFIHCDDIRRTGSAALDFCKVACGRADGFFEYDLKPWDIAAGAVILREAGGTFTNRNGEMVLLDKNTDVVATNGKIQSELLSILYSI